jgi:hypothetical protein
MVSCQSAPAFISSANAVTSASGTCGSMALADEQPGRRNSAWRDWMFSAKSARISARCTIR